MPTYKDIDAILRNLPDDLPHKASVKRVLIQAPEADVVEVVQIFEEIKKYYCINKYGEVIVYADAIDEIENKYMGEKK